FSPVAGCWVILIVIMALRIYCEYLRCEYVTAENLELETRNQQLETQMKNLTDMLQDMKTDRNELNVSRAQWSIDQYCPIDKEDARKCNSCQAGWLQEKSSCYAVIDVRPPDQKTWDGAQADCRERNSELVVINNLKEKEYIRRHSWNIRGINGYWIGLRVVDGKWTWVDRSGLTEISTILLEPPTEGHCAISVLNNIRHIGLKSVNCSDSYAWICEKKALSLAPP
uniref:C-type lectin domain-containing protein n=1 Tax=Sparus aurata TaxID=8175 RepID=A0A671VV84_SPAAU